MSVVIMLCSFLLPAMREVEAHEPVVGLEDSGVDSKVGGGAGEQLDVDAPLCGVEVEGLEGALLAQQLVLVCVLVAAVVAGAGVALGVLVCEAGRKGVSHSLGADVLGRDHLEPVALAVLLLGKDLGKFGVNFLKRSGPLQEQFNQMNE